MWPTAPWLQAFWKAVAQCLWDCSMQPASQFWQERAAITAPCLAVRLPCPSNGMQPPAAWHAGLHEPCQLLMPPAAATHGMMTWHLWDHLW